MKRVFIVHRWEGLATDDWYRWLASELASCDIETVIPQMPETDAPHIETWVPALAQAVGEPDEETYLVGHSIGCQTIAKYLETLGEGKKVGGAVFVAGYFKRLTGFENEGAKVAEIVNEWLTTPLDLTKVRAHLPGSVAIFSDDDPYVPMDNLDDFRDVLGSEIVVVSNKGHMSPSGVPPVTELTEAKQAVLSLMNLT